MTCNALEFLHKAKIHLIPHPTIASVILAFLWVQQHDQINTKPLISLTEHGWWPPVLDGILDRVWIKKFGVYLVLRNMAYMLASNSFWMLAYPWLAWHILQYSYQTSGGDDEIDVIILDVKTPEPQDLNEEMEKMMEEIEENHNRQGISQYLTFVQIMKTFSVSFLRM